MKRRHNIKVCVTTLMMSIMCVSLLPRSAFCRLSGEANLNYVNYDSQNTRHSLSAHSLTQRYSLLYENNGSLAGGRLGQYQVALGYELLTLDTVVKSETKKESYSETRGHLKYLGDLVLRPKELPINLHLYSRDLTRSSFDGADSGMESNTYLAADAGYSSVPYSVSTSINNGLHVESGALLTMGIKNGMTNGYNEVLRHLPMLMLDFKDQVDIDRNRLSPVDTRMSRLAFVSLNKKDNWFHYRYTTFTDNYDDRNNYKESQIQLGTVDHVLRRRWVDFSNWLSVSVDGQFTKRVNALKIENFEEFSLNLFGIARRKSWELRTFNNFTRFNEIDKGTLTYMATMPAYVNGIISPTAGWSAYAKFKENRTEAGESFTSISSGYTVSTNRKSLFTLNHKLGVELVSISAQNSKSTVLTGGIDTVSTPLFSRALSLKAAYDIRNYRTDSSATSSNLIEQSVDSSASYNVTNLLRIYVNQKYSLTTGSSQNISSMIEGAAVESILSDTGVSGYKSTTRLAIDWTPLPRLTVGVGVSEEIIKPKVGEGKTTTAATASLIYSDRRLKIVSKFSYASGDGLNDELSNNIRNTSSASYIFSRSLDAQVQLTYFKMLSKNAPAGIINASQSLNYRYSRNSGTGGRLFEINETFAYDEEYSGDYKNTARKNTLLIGVKYFPLRSMIIAGGTKYYFLNNGQDGALNYYGSVTVGFKLLYASVEYVYGKNKVNNTVEKKISANLNKKF